MGKIIDISGKISNEPTFLHIAENMNWEVQTQRMYSFFCKIVI